ncbi:MAG: YbhB/YbcL family Raf kinase inhibitor-like protein [Acidimicrobiales bacterium]
MDISTRPVAPSPYELLPAVPSFTVTSEDFADGERLDDEFAFSGGNVHPQLSWSGFPAETKSFAVTCFDPDAPTGCGFWHWFLIGVDAGTTSLARGEVPAGTRQARNDFGNDQYDGCAPPPGDRDHRYIFAVHALDVDETDVPQGASPTYASFVHVGHTIARATITGTWSQ